MRGVGRIAPADDHDGVHLPGKLRGGLLALARGRAHRVLDLRGNALGADALEHVVERIAGLRGLHDHAHVLGQVDRQVGGRFRHVHLRTGLVGVSNQALHLGMALLAHHHHVAAFLGKRGGGLLRTRDMRARGIDHGKPARLHRAAHCRGDAMAADDDGAVRCLLRFLDGQHAARLKVRHHLGIMDERPQRERAAITLAGLQGQVKGSLHAVACACVLAADDFHVRSFHIGIG